MDVISGYPYALDGQGKEDIEQGEPIGSERASQICRLARKVSRSRDSADFGIVLKTAIAAFDDYGFPVNLSGFFEEIQEFGMDVNFSAAAFTDKFFVLEI